ncbi:N-acetyltransferase O1 (Establishment of cohesion protein 1) [Didymella heteroderae]|uniref:N-acetyltransferase O1 (Establishment of cohesion protein 1) n=1 Tax=Didymella heteroderae TaxID=1769908 RepID=A0A9P4X150_9PLEO|nr:N-acetyltransferase O1 (Establishment of cohesion protein 1) [Didymella heteroderae]
MLPSSTKKVVRTYSRQTKRPLYDAEPPAKRRRVENANTEPAPPTTIASKSPACSPSPTRIISAPLSSSPQPSPPSFSDAPTRSSPPSSPALESSPPPETKRRPVFSLFKRKLKHSFSAPEILSERSHNAQSPPKPLPPKKKHMVQMQLDLVGQHRKACKTCGMEYIPSNAEDVALHKKFHAMNFGGVDCTKAMVERLRQRQIWSGGEGGFIAVVGRKDALALRNKASDVLKVVNTELAAVPITEEELWGQTTLSASTEDAEADPAVPEKCDRYKIYLHVRGQKCVAACLAERIQEAYTVLAQDKASEEPAQTLAGSQSSSISISTTADKVLLGFSRIWVSSQFRKQGLARRLLDCTRSDFMYGLTVDKRLTAFSQPTESGGKLARKYFGSEAGWHVYMD